MKICTKVKIANITDGQKMRKYETPYVKRQAASHCGINEIKHMIEAKENIMMNRIICSLRKNNM